MFPEKRFTKVHGSGSVILALAMFGCMIPLNASTSHSRSLEDQIRHELVMVPYIGVFDNVSFRIDNGVVTLTGHVLRPVDKARLEGAIKNVAGVTSINNYIEVLPVSRFDDRIRLQTLSTIHRTGALYRYFMGANPSIRIIVKNGNVTLEGLVSSAGDRTLAFLATNGVPGIFSVTNRIEVASNRAASL